MGSTPRIAKPGCNDTCGEVSIPYPFGIGPKCYHNPWFDVECTDFNKFELKALKVSYNLESPDYVHPIGRQINWVEERTLTMEFDCQGYCSHPSNNPNGVGYANSTDLRGSPFLYSSNRNILLVAGCGGDAVLKNSRDEPLTGCAQICRNESKQFEFKHCYGEGCCQTTLPSSLDYFWLDFLVNRAKTCRPTMAVLVDKSWISNKIIDPMLTQLDCPVPSILEWTVPDLPIKLPSYSNSSCIFKKPSNGAGTGGYVCHCKADYYQGNPYLPYGCQVVEVCETCVQDCLSYGNDTFGCPDNINQVFDERGTLKEKAGFILGLGIGISMILLLLLLGAYWIHKVMKKTRETRLKAEYFKRNGGMVLKQLLSSEGSETEKARIFTSTELEKATDFYNRNRILGHGGQGIVYKGMLFDGKIVAIKKFKVLDDERQLIDFINEVKLLSQINHRNIVKLLGCCLETEIPMLVYEYVANATLSEHIVSPNEDFPCTWEMRLQIAIDIANALAYLHSSSLLPIFHRDIKATNILLDNKYRAKLSDFGISKSIAIDQTHVTTRVVGTFGYLDPEYFQSHQFTDKSDVYSFGVVLVELLTGQLANHSTKDERGLVPWFISHIQSNFLYDILDARVMREGGKEKVEAIAELATRCLILDGSKRPSMKEVEATLQTIRSSQQGWFNNLSAIMSMNDDESTIRRLHRSGSC
ncbi:wall-associated receptor kinase-like 1 [Silene latifolia]|uniref:wall-associated receptor kinase-like 1 n=1 Tax=Silene latifolia TaxID=37657 RepID=UPI003D77AB30